MRRSGIAHRVRQPSNRAGYFRQEISAEGQQVERPDWWEVDRWCCPLNAMVAVEIERKPVWIRPWLYIHTCPLGHQIPILFLDTNLDQNAEEDRSLTHYLYGGDDTRSEERRVGKEC